MGLEEKYSEVQKLIDMGKEKGYLLYDEVSDLLPAEITASLYFSSPFVTLIGTPHALSAWASGLGPAFRSPAASSISPVGSRVGWSGFRT